MHTTPRWKSRLAAACLASAVSAVVVPSTWAQDTPKPAATKPHDSATPKLLPEINVKDVTLPDLIDFLRDVDPSFQAVIAYDPGAVPGEPKIQELRLKNVSAEAVLKLLAQTYPLIELQPIAGEAGGDAKIWTIRITADPSRPVPREGGGGGAGLFGGAGGGGEGAPVPEAVTVVHRLREIVDDIAPANGGPKERKAALESVLSLVQATLESGGAGDAGGKKRKAPSVELRLHEATETLIFHGPVEQSGVVGQALEMLAPRPGDGRGGGGGNASVNTAIRQLNSELDRLKRRLGALEAAGAAKQGAVPGAEIHTEVEIPPGGVLLPPGAVPPPGPGQAPGEPAPALQPARPAGRK